jgi:hypothetical protein
MRAFTSVILPAMHTQHSIRIAAVVGSLLLVPAVAMLFTDEVNWDLFDFVVMGAVLFGVGLAYELIARKSRKTVDLFGKSFRYEIFEFVSRRGT